MTITDEMILDHRPHIFSIFKFYKTLDSDNKARFIDRIVDLGNFQLACECVSSCRYGQDGRLLIGYLSHIIEIEIRNRMGLCVSRKVAISIIKGN